MQVTYERSGGFHGLTLTLELDTASLLPDEAQDVEKMIEEADFFSLPASVPVVTQCADAFQYIVTVKADDKQHSVTTIDTAIPDSLLPLIDYLTRVAKEKRRGGALREKGR